MTDEERILWAEELDERFSTIHTFVAESIGQAALEPGGFEELQKDVLGILFELNVEFDLNIHSDAFWSVEIGFREDGDVHFQILPRVVADRTKAGKGRMEIVEHVQTATARRYTVGLGTFTCQSDSHVKAMITMAQFLESGAAETAKSLLSPKKVLN